MTALLEVRSLGVRYGGVRAVDGVDLDIEAGSFLGLIGPNGAGKTSAIDALTGYTSATGTVQLSGQRIDGLPAYARARLGLVRTFQSLELFQELTVRENLLAGVERARWWSPVTNLVSNRNHPTAAESVSWALSVLGLENEAGARPTELSLGTCKRLTVARCLALRPKIMLLDEPAAGLDSHDSLQLGKTLQTVVASGVTVLLVDHDMGLVFSVCENVHVMARGVIIAEGPPAVLREDPKVIEAYLGSRVAARAHRVAEADG